MSHLPFINLVFENRPAFATRLSEIALRLGIDPGWLMIVFYIETAANVTGRIDHKARNAATAATGLIQFMPRTARSLGTNVQQLQLMTNVQQLDYVEKYLLPHRGKMKCLADVYLAVFFPIAIGKPDNWVLQATGLSAKVVAQYNPLYDLNKDGQLTVGEVKAKLRQFVPQGFNI